MSVPRILRFNADFEYALADGPGYRPASRVVQRMMPRAAAMRLLAWDEPVWLLAGAHQSCHVLPPFSSELQWRPLSHETLTPEGPGRYLPWGVTDATRAEARILDPDLILPETAAVREVQGRLFSLGLEQSLGLELPGTRAVDSLAMLLDVLPDGGQWVLKHPFGVAGRERQRLPEGRKSLTPSILGWIRKVLVHHPLILEPWMERVRDWSLQLEIPRSDAELPKILGVLEQCVLGGGTWAGHRLGLHAPPPGLEAVALKVGAAARAAGYWGPLGLDAFEYLEGDGQVRLRPLVEVNARHTMGMCALAVAGKTWRAGVWEWRQLERRSMTDPWPVDAWRMERRGLGLSDGPDRLTFICGDGPDAARSTWALFVWMD